MSLHDIPNSFSKYKAFSDSDGRGAVEDPFILQEMENTRCLISEHAGVYRKKREQIVSVRVGLSEMRREKDDQGGLR